MQFFYIIWFRTQVFLFCRAILRVARPVWVDFGLLLVVILKKIILRLFDKGNNIIERWTVREKNRCRQTFIHWWCCVLQRRFSIFQSMSYYQTINTVCGFYRSPSSYTVAHKWQPSLKPARTTPTPQPHHTNFKRLWCWCGVGVHGASWFGWRLSCGPPYTSDVKIRCNLQITKATVNETQWWHVINDVTNDVKLTLAIGVVLQ